MKSKIECMFCDEHFFLSDPAEIRRTKAGMQVLAGCVCGAKAWLMRKDGRWFPVAVLPGRPIRVRVSKSSS